MNCRKLSLTIQQSMLGGERDRIVPSHDLSNQEGPLLQAFRKLRKETKEALKKQVQITKSTVIIQIHDHLNLRAILITSAKELSNFLKSLFLFFLDLLFDCFNNQAYPRFSTISQTAAASSSYSSPLFRLANTQA